HLRQGRSQLPGGGGQVRGRAGARLRLRLMKASFGRPYRQGDILPDEPAWGDAHMNRASIAEIDAQLQKLPPEKLAIVLDFVSFLIERQAALEAFQTMLASEAVLSRDWDSPEEDEAWAGL